MARYRFGDVVKEVKINVNRDNNPYEFYVAGDHMDSEDLIIRRKGRFLTDDVGPAFTRIFHPGQVLYGSRRTYLKKVAIADFDGICANTTFVLETKDNNIFTQELLPFIMLSDRFTEWSVSHSKGSTNPYVLFSDLADFEIELPDINTQRSLAKKLTSAHNVKESYKTLQKCTDEMVKSQFIEMFGQSSLDNGIIGDYLLLKAGKAMPADRISSSKADGMFPCFGGNGIRGYVDSYNYDGDYAIIGRQGALCGNVCLAQGKFYATEHAVVVTPKAIVDSTWLFFALNQMNLNQYARGVAQPGLAVNELEKLPFSVPDINKQIEFSIIAKQADKSKFELKKSIEAIDKVIKSLINNI